jgi:murein DD-endopeptidase MepM/ murein hydrolase activator NlpD
LAKTPQVHFEVRRNRIARDPAEFLPILPAQSLPGQAASAQSPPAQTM